MPKRLTIAGIMGLIAVVAIGLFSLRFCNRLIANAMLSLAIGAVVASVVIAIGARGRLRAFCRGFAIAAGVYLLLATAPGLDTTLGYGLVTTPLIDLAYERTKTSSSLGHWLMYQRGGGTGLLPKSPAEYWLGPPTSPFAAGYEAVLAFEARPFFQVCHSVFGLLAGVGGGLLGFHVARMTRGDRLAPATVDTP